MKIRRKILIADSTASAMIKRGLCEAGYDVIVAASLKESCELMTSHCPDLVIVRSDGDIEAQPLINELRSWSDIPAIVICSELAEYDSLPHGYADFIVEPFMVTELLMRVRIAMKNRGMRRISDAGACRLSVGGLVIDHDQRRVSIDGREVGLTNNEYRMVELLARNKDVVTPYEYIQQQLWGPNCIGGNQLLRVNMANIRRKIEKDTSLPRYFHTIPGVGYKLSDGK